MSIFRKSEDHHAGSGFDKPAPKTIGERVSETFSAPFRSLTESAPSEKGKQEKPDPTALDIPPAD